MSTIESFPCPSCEDVFDTQRGLSGHHVRAHDESLAKKTVTCDWCGSEEDIYPSRREHGNRFFCSNECKGNALSQDYSQKIEVECKNCNKNYKVSPSRYKNGENFCSSECVIDYFRGEKSPNWKGGAVRYYGENWNEQRESALQRDSYECVECGITNEESVNMYGRELDVHHIKPIRDFDCVELANKLDNLVTVCRSCHRKLEDNTQ